MDKNLNDSIAELQKKYEQSQGLQEKDVLYKDLLEKYEAAQKRIAELETEASKSKLPSKDEVDTIATMLDLINKIDDTTLDKLNKFGKKS